MDKALYSCRAPFESTRKAAVLCMAFLVLLCAALMLLAGKLPYAGILRLLAILIFALGVYGVMKRSLFDIEYVLYEDRLEFRRRYGAVTAVNEVFPKNEARFFEDKIIFRGKSYPFHPDKKLKELLNI